MIVTLLAAALSLASPDGRLMVEFNDMTWSLKRDGVTLIEPSSLGLKFAKSNPQSVSDMAPLKVIGEVRRSADSTWETRLYRKNKVRDHYNELTIALEESEARSAVIEMGATEVKHFPRKLSLVFRAYDEGVAFRYVIPEQEAFDGFEILDELTEWHFADDPWVWATEYKSECNSQERPFERKRLSEIKASQFVGMPLLVEVKGSTLALTEAALVNWAGIFYRNMSANGSFALKADLSELPASSAATPHSAVINVTPAKSPWRVMMVGDNELDLLKKNDIIVNLNPDPDPSIDFSFVKPGVTSWDWWVESNNSLSTEQTLKLIDMSAEMGWQYHTIDGGWYGFSRRPNHGPNVELKPRKGFDLARIVAYAKAKGIGIWVWIHWQEINDTGIEETFSRLEKWGIAGVKTDFLDRQDQWIVNWYEKVARTAAKHRIMINFHGAFKPTGTERTWPNNLTREGVLGNELNLFSYYMTAKNSLTLPFTRFLLGPGDFTPGSFANVHSKDFIPQCKTGHRYGDETDRCPHWAEQRGTRGFAIAQVFAYDSPLTTMCDWPERYRGAAGVEAIRSVPTTWARTISLAGKCGEFYAVARATQDGKKWYLAAMTDKARELELPLTFLVEGAYKAEIFADDPEKTPQDAKALLIEKRILGKTDTLRLRLGDEGGALVIFTK